MISWRATKRSARSGRGSGAGRRCAGPPTSRTGACRPSRSCRPRAAAFSRTARPQAAQLLGRLGRERQGSVATSSTDSCSSGLISPASTVGVLEHRLDRVGELERLGVEDHQLLLDADRVAGAGELVLHGAGSLPGGRLARRQNDFEGRRTVMALGYDGKLYILAFDHRGSFQKKMFGIQGDPTDEETQHDRRRQAPHLRGHGQGGRSRAPRPGPPACSSTSSSAATSPPRPRRPGSCSSMPVEKSGQDEFDFQYGDAVRRAHRASSTPTSPRCSSATTPTATRR